MLGKLFKHEFKNTGKVLLPLELVLIGMTLLGMLVIGLGAFESDNTAVNLILVSMILFYVLGIIALFIVTYIFLMMRFYRSMYSAEGYLTNTLPVSSFAIVNVKILVSAFWAFLTMVLTIVSVLVLILTGVKATGQDISFQMIANFMEVEMNYPVSNLIGWVLLSLVLSSFSGLLMIYCSISIGQLFNKYKVLASFITYGVIYIILQVVNTLLTIGQTVSSLTDESYYSTVTDSLSAYTGLFTSSNIQNVILIAIYYTVTMYISHKKLNLE